MSTGRPARILILDDEFDWREILSDILTRKNRDDSHPYRYVVHTAANIPQAKDLIARYPFHVWVLDMNMIGIETPGNTDGLAMLEEYYEKQMTRDLAVFMISGYADKNTVRDAMKLGVRDFFFKGGDEGFDEAEFVREMQEVFDNMAEGEEVRINLDLNINWQGDIKTAAEAAEGMLVGGQRVKIVTEAAVEEADSPEDRQKKQMQRDLWQRTEIEIEDLLCRLYHRASSIQIRTLTGGYSGALVLHVKPLFDGIMGRPQVTKIGHLAAITREYKNHRDYVQDYLARVPNAVDYMRTAQLAGINYTFVEGPGGEDLNDFETFYEEHSFDAIKALLDDLFNTVCINWYNGRQLEECRLSESYRHDLKLRKGKLEEALKHLKRRIQTGQDTIVVPEIDESHHFVNPIPVAMNRDIMLFAFRSMTHGDLNARNILVDNNDHAWLIDFSHTEIGHMLRDIAKLDSVLRIQMLSQQEATLQERFYLEETLADAASPNQIMQLSDQLETDNPALQKVYRTVRYLRQYAATISNGSASMEDYDVALMYNNISAITYYSLSKLQRLHGLLSASLLARRVRDR